uniref:Uncharacterized protein n=1 Tax=Magallana gigas TaxID=29159 RepID=A0A8W8MYT2_MAGGI
MVVEDLQVPVPKKKPGPDRKLDDFDADLVKRTIHDMQLKGQYVSLRQLSDVLVEKGVRLTKSSLGRLVKDLGFRFYKAGSNQRYIGDRNDIVFEDLFAYVILNIDNSAKVKPSDLGKEICS